MTFTAPAPAAVPTPSEGAPTARSALPSPLRSPAASAVPNESPGFGPVGDPVAALGQGLLAGGGEAVGRAVEDVDGASVAIGPDVLARRADREIGVAVSVEVAGCQRRSEHVSGRGPLAAAEVILRPGLARPAAEAAARPIDDVDVPGTGRGPDALA